MPVLSLLLRVLLIVALSLNGYASAAMIASDGHAMGARAATAAPGPSERPGQTAAMADCHDGMDPAATAQAEPRHGGPAPAGAGRPGDPPDDPASPHEGDCCGKFACQCDCLQAASIAHAVAPLPPRLISIAPALANAHAPPSGVLSLPNRPPIA